MDDRDDEGRWGSRWELAARKKTGPRDQAEVRAHGLDGELVESLARALGSAGFTVATARMGGRRSATALLFDAERGIVT